MVEGKVPLQTMGPLPTTRVVVEILPPPLSPLAMVLSLPDIGALGPSSADAELDDELQRLLALQHLGSGEADDTATITMDLSFIESMVTGLKEMQARHHHK